MELQTVDISSRPSDTFEDCSEDVSGESSEVVSGDSSEDVSGETSEVVSGDSSEDVS